MVNPKFAEALAVIRQAKGTVVVLLSGPDSANVSLSIVSKLDKAIHQLEFLTGSGVSAAGDPEAFPPVTNFMGEDIVVKEPVEVVVDPTEEERRIFLGKVDNIINSLLSETLTPGQVVVNSPLPEDELVIRGAAKRAGQEDFDTAEISTAFVDRIKAALLDQEAETARQDDIEQHLQGGLSEVVSVPVDAMGLPEVDQEAETAKSKKKGK